MPLLDSADNVHRSRDREQLARGQTAAGFRTAQTAAAIYGSAERRRAEPAAESNGVVGLFEQQLNALEDKLRLEVERRLLRVLERRHGG